ncbi:MAG: CDP-glucose 4,6-dehydratase, partial [Rhabdaerophilum calidifontis]
GEVRYGDGSRGPHEANWLALEIAKARTTLGIGPRWGLRESVERTIRWYREEAGGADAATLCAAEIAAFEDGR